MKDAIKAIQQYIADEETEIELEATCSNCQSEIQVFINFDDPEDVRLYGEGCDCCVDEIVTLEELKETLKDEQALAELLSIDKDEPVTVF